MFSMLLHIQKIYNCVHIWYLYLLIMEKYIPQDESIVNMYVYIDTHNLYKSIISITHTATYYILIL